MQKNELKCPECFKAHCKHCECNACCSERNKTTDWEEQFDKEFVGGVKSSLGDYISNKTGRRIKQFISQERKQWEEELRKEGSKYCVCKQSQTIDGKNCLMCHKAFYRV